MGSLSATEHFSRIAGPPDWAAAAKGDSHAESITPTSRAGNPYSPGHAAADLTMFFGRQAELGILLARLADAGHTAVVGPPGIGVSSLLRRVPVLPQAAELLITYVNLSDPANHSPGGLAQALWSGWWSQVRPGYVPAIDGLGVLETLANRLNAAGHRLVALLDGYEQLVWRPASFDAAFWARLETLIRTGPITWVAGSHRSLVELHQQAEIAATPYEVFVQQDVGLLDEAGALAMLSRPMERAGFAWPAAEAVYLVELAGPHPLFLQLAGHVAFEALAAGRYDRERVAGHFQAAAEPLWQEMWLSLPPTARAALALGRKAPADAAFVARQVRSLGRKGLVVGQGRDVRLFSRGFAEWSRQMQRATQLAREASAETVIEPIG